MKLDLTDLPEGTYTLIRTKDGYSLERLEPYPYAGGGAKSDPPVERVLVYKGTLVGKRPHPHG